MRKALFCIVIQLICLKGLVAQPTFTFPQGFYITDQQSFSGESLYGKINGGAELFLEYGFEGLNSYLVNSNNTEYAVDIYKMSDALSAYGIFSIKRYKCAEDSLPNSSSCQTKYQLSLIQSEYFITIANDKGTDKNVSESLLIGTEILKSIPKESIEIPQFDDIFNFENPGFTLLLKGKLGFQNGNPAWDSFFEGYSGYKCFYRKATNAGMKLEMFQVDFPDKSEAERFIKSKGWNITTAFQDESKTWFMKQEENRVLFAKGNSINPR